MTEYRRVNLDGKGISETRGTAAALKPGTFVVINSSNKWAQAGVASAQTAGQIYVLDAAWYQGLGITDSVPAGDSGIGYYAEVGREFAALVAAGTYTKDQRFSINSSGQLIPVPTSGAGTYYVVASCQDDVTLSAADFIRVRIIDRQTVVIA